jgi:hypothetical protein
MKSDEELRNDHNEDEDDEDSEKHPLMANQHQQLQQMRVLDNEIEYNEAIIQEREEDLRQIERSIMEVNEIFRDLGTLVNEQQYMLGTHTLIFFFSRRFFF